MEKMWRTKDDCQEAEHGSGSTGCPLHAMVHVGGAFMTSYTSKRKLISFSPEEQRQKLKTLY